MTGSPLSAEQIVGGYEALFDPRTRAAHRACLEHARLVRGEPWPSIADCLRFAGLFGVPGAELAAFFGYLSYRERDRSIWVDGLCGPVPSHLARQRATRGQAMAFGFQCAAADLFMTATSA